MVKPCKVTYGGKEYSIEEYLGILHDGLLDQLVNDGVIDDSNFVQPLKPIEKTEDEISREQTQETEILLNGLADKRRKDGKFVRDGVEYVRNEKGLGELSDKKGEVRFTNEISIPFRYKLVEANTLQPSHQDGIRNSFHFIPEAQPKNRNDKGSLQAEESFANNPRFNELGESTNAYSGAPVVNERNEVIQGNNRSAGLRKGYSRGNEEYKNSLIKNAAKFGFTEEQVSSMESPILVRQVAVSDEGAIEIGNYDVKDLETGGIRRLDPVAITRRMPFSAKGRMAELMFSGDETLNQTIRDNQKKIIEIISPYINQAQRNTIIKDGVLSDIGIKDIEDIAKQFLFDNGSSFLPEIFENLSATQKEGLKRSLPYIFSVPPEKGLVQDIQVAIIAINDFNSSGAGSFNGWLSQADMFNEGLTPKDKYSPLEIAIAKLLVEEKTQKGISSVFSEYARAVTDKPADMFEPAKEGKSRAEGVLEIFKVEDNERPSNTTSGEDVDSEQKDKAKEKAEPSERKTINIRTPPAVQKKEPEIKIKALSEIEAAKEKFAKAKEMAAAIRGAKIDGKGKAFDATLGLPVAIWNGAIETVASAIEAGVAVADAIKRGLNYIQKNNRGAWNKKAYNDRVIEELGLRGIEVNGEDLIVQPLEDKATVELVNGFYSPLEKGIAEAKTDKATGKGWMKVLSGVTEADELNYTGVKDFLNSNADRPISKKELLDFMKNNRIEVVEIVKGRSPNIEKEEAELKKLGYSIEVSMGGDFEVIEDGEGTVSFYELPGEAQDIVMEITNKLASQKNDTKFSQYQLEGEKENYKELLVTLPIKEKNEIARLNGLQEEARVGGDNERVQYYEERINKIKSPEFKSSHFDEPNILVHLRMNTRTDVDGNKVLFIEEVQSDWGQKGKREGFESPKRKATDKKIAELWDKQKEAESNVTKLMRKAREEKPMTSVAEQISLGNKEVEQAHNAVNEIQKQRMDLVESIRSMDGGVINPLPTAPFVTDTNAWTKLGLKTALKEAVKQGADKLAWTTGEQQNDRYDLSKSVKRVDFIKVGENRYKYEALDLNSKRIAFDDNGTTSLKDIESMFGKDIAEKVKADKKGDLRLEGDGLKVGGKGMKGFYGSPKEGSLGIVGNVAKTLFKQEPKTTDFGGKVEIDGEDILRNGKKVGNIRPSKFEGDFIVENDDNGERFAVKSKKEAINIFQKGSSTQHSIDITPELKEAVKEGIPLFKNDLVQAKERLKEAKANLDKFNNRLGIASDPKENAKALFEYHKALVGLAKAYIKAGVNSIKDFAKEIGENITQEVKDAWNEAKGISKKTLSDFKAEIDTSLINEEVKLKRDIYGFDEPLLRETKPNPELLEEAIQNIKDGESVYDIIDKVNNGEPLTDVETVMLAQFQGTKQAELYKINKKIETDINSSPLEFEKTIQRRNEIKDDLLASFNAGELSGSVTGRALQARKVRVLQDYSLANMLARTRNANNNRPLTIEQLDEVTARFDELIEAEAKLKAKVEQLTKDNENLKLAKSEARLRKEAVSDIKNRNRAEVKEALKKERFSILEDISKAIQRSRGKISMNPIPDEVFPLIGKLAKNYFLDGITSIETIVDNVYEDVKGLIDGVTKRDVRDAISGYGRDVRPTQDELQRELYDLREQAKLISRIEDAESGVKKAKDERVKRVASDEAKKLRARLKDLTKEEASLEAIKKSLKRRIAETKTKLDKKDYSRPQKIEVELDDEAKKLQDAYRKIKFEFDVAVEKDKLANRTDLEKWQDVFLNVVNVSRALMATADLSAPLRQSVVVTISRPVTASKSFMEMLRQWYSKDVAETWLADLRDSPGYQLMEKSGLYIADRTSAKVTAKEEDFQSNLAEKIPLFGRLVAKSERAYVGYLNKMRADLFNQGVEVLQNDGVSFASNPKAYKALATYINAATGRGNLGKLESAAPLLNTAIFSPRLMASRAQLLTNFANPLFYKNTPAAVRKMYFKDMGTFIVFGMGILALAALSGADTEEDPRSPDFGKIRSGNTRWDIWGGFQQFIRYATQFALAEKKSTASGKITPLDGSSYSKETQLSVIGNFFRSKLAPIPSAVVDYFDRENMTGDPFNLGNTLISRLTPLVGQGIYESAKQDGWLFAITATGIPSVLGVGVQTYGLNDFLKQGVDDKSIKLLIDKKAVAIEPKETERTVIDAVTGEKRKMDDDEFEKYYASWADYIKKDLKENYSEYEKMSLEKFESEFRKIKSNATSYAKEQVTNVIPETLTLEIDNVTYKLTPDKVAERKEYIQEYIDENEDKRSFERKIEKLIENGSIKDTPTEIKKILMSDAKEYATKKMKKEYKDNPDELGVIED